MLHLIDVIKCIKISDFLVLTKLNPISGFVKLSRFIGIYISEIKTPPCRNTFQKSSSKKLHISICIYIYM